MSPSVPAAAAVSAGGRVIASPYARKLARESGVNLMGIAGSGPGGRIIAADVAHQPTSGKAVPVATGAVSIINNDGNWGFQDIKWC